MLTVIKYSMVKPGGAHWICRCDCGKEKEICGGALRLGRTVSCGCYGKRTKNSPDDLNYWFWPQVKKSDTCWNWLASPERTYGAVFFNGRKQQAHRVSYQLFRGEIPDGLNVCHKCDNPKCVNPEHLFLGTQQDNIDDMMRKGRHRSFNIPFGSNSGRSKLTEEQALEIIGSDLSMSELAKQYGMSRSGIRYIKARIGWKHLG